MLEILYTNPISSKELNKVVNNLLMSSNFWVLTRHFGKSVDIACVQSPDNEINVSN